MTRAKLGLAASRGFEQEVFACGLQASRISEGRDLLRGFAGLRDSVSLGHGRPQSPYVFGFLSLSERNRIEDHLEQGGTFALYTFEIRNFLVFS